MRKLPSLSMLRVFEETCRTLSFSKAADALFITQSAASRQMKQLEEFLGKLLFVRSHSGLALTQDAMLLLPVVRQSLDILEEGVRHVQLHNPLQHLRLQIAPTFATRWLAPRLVTLRQRNSQLQIALISETRQKYCDFDCAVRFGQASEAVDGEWLCHEQLVLVGSPLLMINGVFPPLNTQPQLHILDGDSRMDTWQRWLAAAGRSEVQELGGLEFSTQDQVINACITGAGYAVLDKMMIRNELNSGLLILLSPLELKSTNGYWLEIPPGKRELPRVQYFHDWLRAEIGRVDAVNG
ncbi:MULTISPECIES: LysR substrate-binding domain-containing protein [Serratia]|uniref:LysR substrate-binding domain-containing protein n=1 Tax=Serratia TaxID=613 RepID=UPI0004658982|nr:LysR substrate-binding domain-containing protein [Serratia fonticola]MDQ7212427.1 LysR substrate-binding domain-containing protein [Serratia fonticola]HBE9082617.1 LysR family transcriptional regulator [Serratia fonticola]HBE9093189.1 LysR family transcriptional regulator [Serratia fonticola]HBE9155495.1 LysR family transcriptional regulator [Serratia fonticola]